MIRSIALALAALAAAPALNARDPLLLHYARPARQWTEALPVGNGRMGAMIFGGAARERIQFNESTMWTGAPHDYAHPGASRSLGEIRRLLFAGRQKEAEDLATREFMSLPLGQKAYQGFGDVFIEFPEVREDGVTGYRRELDLDTGIAAVEYTSGGIAYRRETFASHPADAVAIRLTAGPGSLSFRVQLKSAHPGAAMAIAPEAGTISMTGGMPDGAIRFEARLAVLRQGGSLRVRDGWLELAGAESATLILAGATNFRNYRDVGADPEARNHATLERIGGVPYQTLRSAHVADHQRLFRRVSLSLGSGTAADLPTDERIARFAETGDPRLLALLFQFGRYLLIAASRPGGQPATLQGLWNDSNTPPWDSKYTCNINTEMNYWPAGVGNLAECQLPLFDALGDLAVSGAVTAREHYGAAGWVLHHNFDLWRGTAPINGADHGIWQTGGAWLATHLWEHFLFTGDRAFLRDTAWPLMKGAALFFADALVEDPRSGLLITGPSNSPEQGGLVMGPAMDRQIVRTLFAETAAAAGVLGTDDALRQRLEALRKRIAPDRIGRHGQLQEWMDDLDDPANQHRHVSHLWSVYPGSQITPLGTPDLFGAARRSLEFRGDAATGWSMGWKTNLWARFGDGDHALRILRNLVTPASDRRAGLYPNMMDAHPPFQINGNFGAAAGIAELLLQSHNPRGQTQTGEAAFVHLLPALPAAWPEGSVSGLMARGAVEVGMVWKAGQLVRATLRTARAKPVTIRYAGKEIRICAQAGRAYVLGPDLRAAR